MFKVKPNNPANYKTEEIVNIMKAVSKWFTKLENREKMVNSPQERHI